MAYTESIFKDFGDFDVSSISSWAEFELKAVICGANIDKKLIYSMCFLSYYDSGIYTLILDGIINADGNTRDIFNSIEFVNAVFSTWNSKWRTYRSSVFKLTNAFGANTDMTAKKMNMLVALNHRFPYLLLKFYATYKDDLYKWELGFVSWLLKKVQVLAKTDPKLTDIVKEMETNIADTNRLMMFVS